MKIKMGTVCLIGLIFAVWGIYLEFFRPQTNPVLPFLMKQPTTVLMERADRPVRGQIVTPATTAELRELMTPSNLTYVPRVFVDRLPDDFATEGDKDLFAKVILALILRENEKILTDRAVLLQLRAKKEAGEIWSEQEESFFRHLVQKYDSGARRKTLTQLADLEGKINIIPPMMAVIQAAEATDWGKKNRLFPYEQTGWLDTKTYDKIPFESLIAATESYAREMNGMPPFADWRMSRFYLGRKGHTDMGYRVLQWIGAYKIEDPNYPQKLYDRVQEFGNEISDNAAFFPDRIQTLKTRLATIGKQSFTLEVAQTPAEKEQGLMFRRDLKPGSGMIFPAEKAEYMAFWMKNTFIPLDILFYDEALRVSEVFERVPPLDETIRRSRAPVAGFIELPAGTIERTGIRLGDPVRLSD